MNKYFIPSIEDIFTYTCGGFLEEYGPLGLLLGMDFVLPQCVSWILSLWIKVVMVVSRISPKAQWVSWPILDKFQQHFLTFNGCFMENGGDLLNL